MSRGLSSAWNFVCSAFLFVALLLSVVVGPGIITWLQPAAPTQAAGDFSIKTGYYLGTGATQSITGIGFTPQMIIIKSDTAAGPMVWKSTSMPATVTSYLGVATADNTDTEIVLDANGFTLSVAAEVNTVNVRYTYIAVAGSDCTATGVFCLGVYTGNGAANMAVNTGFQPDLVWVKRTTAVAGSFRTSSMAASNAGFFAATANDATGVFFQTLDATGFTVGATNNVNGSMFYYVAFKNLASKMTVGQFTGDGVDNRNITGLGFEPDFVLVKQNAALAAVYNTTETWGDYSSLVTATANTSNNIQDLISDGFQVGNTTNVNALGVVSYYFAFGGAPDPAPAGSYFMQRGSFTGNGTSQSVTTSFAPDLVIVKGNTTQYAVFSTSLNNDLTHYFALSAVGFSGGITGMNSNSFSVGSNATVNSNGLVYEWIAFGNATSPHKGNGAADFMIGSSTGSAINSRVIDHLGMAPNMVTVKRTITTATVANWQSSTMAANTSGYFAATADTTDGTIFQTLNSDGFTVGTASNINAAGGNYIWFAFKESSRFDVGSYAGNGTANTDINTVGFAPGWVWVKRSTAVRGVHRSSSATITGANAQHFLNVANETNHITAFVANGFTVGNSTEVNASGGAYQYSAWRLTTSSFAPNTPTNVTPANAAITQNLNTVLTGSAYSDADTNPHTDTTWQVDNDNTFATPVWSRVSGAAEITTTVDTSNGTFVNELAGKTELDHNTVYYWRVRYSDGVWSNWSTTTSYTTNTISTPTNTTPADSATINTLTPTLMASAFSDEQGGHTSLSAQWQIFTSTNLTSPYYDSGAVSYSNAHAVPAAILSDRSVYYWRVRFADSSSQWSAYSTMTRFVISEALVTVRPLFGSTVVDQGNTVLIDSQVKLASGEAINDATVTINVYNPTGTKIVNAATMTYFTGSTGIYRYSFVVPATSGSYLYEVTAVSNSRTGFGAGNFEVRTISADVSSIKSTVDAEQSAQNAERAAQAAERAAQAAERAAQGSERTAQGAERLAQGVSRTNIEDLQDDVDGLTTTVNVEQIAQGAERTAQGAERTAQSGERTAQATERTSQAASRAKIDDIKDNVDILIGAMIMTRSTINDPSPTTTAFVTSLTNVTNNFYKNAVLTFTNGSLNGQVRRVAGYNGTTKVITLDPALSFAPANGDAFTIVKQNVYVEEQLAQHEAADAAFRTDTTNRLTSIEDKIDDITANLNSVDTDLATLQGSVSTLRTSQQKTYQLTFSDVSDIQAGNTYRAKLTILDFESNPVNANTAPTIVLYDATRATAQAATPMTQLSTGVYEYTYAVAPAAVTGLWESVVSADMGGSANIVRNDYWQVTGAPAQVIIHSISDLSVPTIAANVTITNEGGGPFEYKYEWCVVANQDNACGGNDDVYYASAAKLINAGDDFDTILNATVPNPGTYYFKLVVYFGTQASGSAVSFTAVPENVVLPVNNNNPSSGGGSIFTLPTQFTDQTVLEMQKTRQQLEINATRLSQVLESLGFVSPNLQTLLAISNEDLALDKEMVKQITALQNKLADLQAISSATRRVVEQHSVDPVVETYMKFGSVEIHFLITNPDSVQQTVKFKAFLPEEVRPEHILDLDGLQVDYDTNAGVYFVSGDIRLAGKETVTKKVKMQDIWMYKPEVLQSLKSQAAQLTGVLKQSQYDAQGTILQSDIDATLNIIQLQQEQSYSSPQDHIVSYRENKERMARVQTSLDKLKDLVVQASASKSVVGEIGGIQTFATWGIVVAIMFGFSLLAAVIFAMWRHQTRLAAALQATRMAPQQTLEPEPLPQIKKRTTRRKKAD